MSKKKSTFSLLVPDPGNTTPKKVTFEIPTYMYANLEEAARRVSRKVPDLIAKIFMEHDYPLLLKDLEAYRAREAADEAARKLAEQPIKPPASQSSESAPKANSKIVDQPITPPHLPRTVPNQLPFEPPAQRPASPPIYKPVDPKKGGVS